MKAYIQLYNNYVVLVSDTEMEGLIEVQLPEDFDYNHINWYEYTEDGQFIKHEPEPVEPTKTYEERITALEEQLVAYEQSYAKGVQDA